MSEQLKTKNLELKTAVSVSALSDFTLDEFTAQIKAWGHPTTHAQSILRAYYLYGRVALDEMKLGRALGERFGRDFQLWQSTIARRLASADGTVKLLLNFARGGAAEAVLMPTRKSGRVAGCVSSQIGCAMGCDFCASTTRGLERNLESGEIVEQFLQLRREALQADKRLHTLVFMGMGEPLQNYDNVTAAIRRIAGGELGALGWRQVTVSTVGIVPGIYKLAESKLNVNLALSLHGPDDETRAQIVPMNRRFPIAEIVAAARHFYATTKRVTNIEYCMLSGVNDSDEHAHRLASLLKGFHTHVNLIPYNPIGPGVSGRSYSAPDFPRIRSFLYILREAGLATHVRQSRGDDVNAACGQLARSEGVRG